MKRHPSSLLRPCLLVMLLLATACTAKPQHRTFSSISRGGSSVRIAPGKSRNSFSGMASSSQQQQQSSKPKLSVSSTEAEDEAATKEMIESFLSRDNRNKFIARVYAILSIQLVVTASSCLAFSLIPNLAASMRTPGSSAAIVPMISLVLSSICWYWMCLSPTVRRESPKKWTLLTLFTLGEAISVGFLSSFYKLSSVVSAMGATALATGAISLYTILQKNPYYDLTQWGAGLSACGVIFLVYGLLGLLQMTGVLPSGFLPYTDMAYSMIGSCLFAMYLAYHTRLVVGGKHAKFCMSDKDYVFAAMMLYNDVINMFIYLLRLMGEEKD